MPKVPFPYEVNGKLVTGNGFLICTNFFLIKPFLIAKFECNMKIPCGRTRDQNNIEYFKISNLYIL